MDQFKQAVDLARAGTPAAQQIELVPLGPPINPGHQAQEPKVKSVILKAAHLESMRIVSYVKEDPRARSFDMLRTQVLQTMDHGGWQFLAVTSPTPGTGKTVTACNLALSIARLPERSVLLVDMDMRKPNVTNYLGIKRDLGLLSVLQGRQTLSEAVVRVGTDREQLVVLPGEQTNASSEWMASTTMATLLQAIKREFRSHIVIVDLPPVLAGDDVLSILPQLQSVLLVAGAGSTSVSEIKECTRHLKATPVVRVVVNKITEREPVAPYHEYY
jgi:protein-tyrosine kinase